MIVIDQGKAKVYNLSKDGKEVVLGILQKGVRLDILNAIKKYGDELVRDVAIKNTDRLTQSVISMLENLWKIQLTMDGASYSA